MDLVVLYKEDKLNLNPPYQRNSIWTDNTQKLLIDTLKRNWPLPTFFLQEKEDGFEMVDGQQRTRALLAYVDTNGFVDDNGLTHVTGEFDDYQITSVVLSKDMSIEEVREFYVRVNRSGARLERPELNKAEFYETKFLKLTTELSEMVEFRELSIFSKSHIRRMFDRDFVEELAAQIIKGPTDKKITVDHLYKSDVTDKECSMIKKEFTIVMEKIAILNEENPLSESRFTQKNDFYTLFGLLRKLLERSEEELIQLYKVILAISKGISPSNTKCAILKEYADNCVTQSNAKRARLRRLEILEQLLLNENASMNDAQKDVANYYGYGEDLVVIGPYHTFSLEK